MGLIEERGEGQPKHEGGQGDESPGEKEEPQQRSRQPEFPSWQVMFLISNCSLHGGCFRGRWVGGMLPGPKSGQWGQHWGPALGARVGNLTV